MKGHNTRFHLNLHFISNCISICKCSYFFSSFFSFFCRTTAFAKQIASIIWYLTKQGICDPLSVWFQKNCLLPNFSSIWISTTRAYLLNKKCKNTFSHFFKRHITQAGITRNEQTFLAPHNTWLNWIQNSKFTQLLKITASGILSNAELLYAKVQHLISILGKELY